ncbi:MAG: phage holin family protein [Baekduiaceae bacterium]
MRFLGICAAMSDGDRSAGDLVHSLSEDTALLIRQELRLAQLELQEKGKRAGIGAGLFGGSGLLVVYAVGALVAAAIAALATAVATWLAALIVAVVLLAIAGAAALTGKKQIEQATPPVPQQAVASSQKDIDTVKEAAQR